jgi:diguanylate cyclase (GGDEF)-like protein
MQLGRFEAFVKEIEADDDLITIANPFNVYRFYDKKWFDRAGRVIEDKVLCENLEKTRTGKTHWRERRSCQSYFPIEDLDCIVEGIFGSPPRKATRDRFHELLKEGLKHAMNAFNASHDVLTGLLNKAAFEEILKKFLSKVAKGSGETDRKAETIGLGQVVVLLALDIDHFKQINDTYGHMYGDVVLCCFAMRIERLARNVETNHGNRVKIYIGRPSGEEFLILLSGRLSVDECFVIADEFRTGIGENKLPSEEDLRAYPDQEKLTTIKIPKLQERNVTVSVGMAYLVGTTEEELEKSKNELERQADTALHYAKAGGRNTIRYFPDIVNKYGTVLEHHTGTNVVTIDVGRQLKVKVGQEFLVYHPDFTGRKAFIYKDGRTEKILGTYPRLPMGRIVVFNIQEDISFCNLAECHGLKTIPIGSNLEAVPLGSISHLIGQEYGISPFEEPNLVPAEKLLAIVTDAAERKLKPFVAVFVLNESDMVINERGTAFANEALANLFRSMKDELPANAKISQIKSIEFAVYLEEISGSKIVENVKNTLSAANQKCKKLASFSAGYFCSQLVDKKEENKETGDQSKLEAKHTLQYARYGASIAGRTGKVIMFQSDKASHIVYYSRKKGLYLQAVEDYKNLVELGIKNAYLENQIGLCAIETSPPDYKRALESFEKATKLNPKDVTLWSNLGLTYYGMENRPSAASAFVEALNINPKHDEIPAGYLSVVGVCLYSLYKQKQEHIKDTELLRLLIGAKENFGKSVMGVSEDEINEGIKVIEKAIKGPDN